MLFKAQAFESPSIDCPEKLYSLNILNRLNKQPLPLKEAMNDDFIFCQAVHGAHGIRIAYKLQLTSASV